MRNCNSAAASICPWCWCHVLRCRPPAPNYTQFPTYKLKYFTFLLKYFQYLCFVIRTRLSVDNSLLAGGDHVMQASYRYGSFHQLHVVHLQISKLWEGRFPPLKYVSDNRCKPFQGVWMSISNTNPSFAYKKPPFTPLVSATFQSDNRNCSGSLEERVPPLGGAPLT